MSTLVLPIDSGEATLAEVDGKGVKLSQLSRTGPLYHQGF